MPIDMKNAIGLLAASAVRRSIKPKALALAGTVLMSTLSASVMPAMAQDAAKPNILVIFGDDIGQTNISAYSMGVMGYKTPNIDRLASEGMMFTDYYAENSCTAGRSTFITGQSVLRTGMSKVGVPGAPGRHPGPRRNDRPGAEAARLCDGPVRQEPPGRPGSFPPDSARFRRILRQPLSPQCRGRAGAPLLAEGSQ